MTLHHNHANSILYPYNVRFDCWYSKEHACLLTKKFKFYINYYHLEYKKSVKYF